MEIHTFVKTFPTEGAAIKWINKQIKDTHYRVINADVKRYDEKRFEAQVSVVYN